MAKYKYYIVEHGESAETAIEFESSWGPMHAGWIAEDAAEYGYGNNDLWEADWPLTFVIVDEDDNELGRYVVEIESTPSFCARKAQ